MNNETKNNENFVLFDAKGQILGRMATEIAGFLSGKNEVDYDPRLGGSKYVVVINSDKVRLSGEKEKKKQYWRHSGYPGGIYVKTFAELKEEDSREIIIKAVKGMLPKNKLSRKALTRLRVFKDENHPHKGNIS
jgi:large subunit ribosomal protein L13